MKKIALLLLTSLLTVPIMSKDKSSIKVIPVNADDDAANGGVIYSLPKTIIRIKVEAELTIKKAGPYYKYSNKYLNISNVITEDSKQWKLLSAKITSYGDVDPNKRYKIVATNSDIPSISLNDYGILTGINTPEETITPSLAKEETTNYIDNITFDDIKLSRSVLTKTSTAAMAEEAALTIYKLRDKRMSLLGGEDATILNDKGSYDKVLDEINNIENDYLSLFIGKTETIKVTRYFDIEPMLNQNSYVAFRFSETDGFLNAMDITGKPVYVDLAFNPNKISSLGEDTKKRQKEPLTGLRYIIPGMINVKVIDRKTLLAEENILCTQTGQEATLPSEVLSNNYSIKIDPNNGSIKKLITPNKSNNTTKSK